MPAGLTNGAAHLPSRLALTQRPGIVTRMRFSARHAAATLALGLVIALAGMPATMPAPAQQAAASAQEAPPAPAGYVVLEDSDVPIRLDITGRAVAFNTTRLRPRVGGMITAILFTPGASVQAGDPLFVIDRLAYETALASATATREGAEAALRNAESVHDRALRLHAAAAGSAAALDDAEAALLKARSALAAARAAEELARAQLDWTTVRAPFAGIIGISGVSVGDLVTANQSEPLAEITAADPILIDLNVPETARQRIEARIAAGEVTSTPPTLTVILDDGRRIEGGARLISTGATVSPTTGTRVLRFEQPNPDGLLAPGSFVHAELVLGHQRAILVPQRATQRQRDGTLTAWVARDGKAELRKLAEAGTEGNAWVVTAGLAAGDWLLIDGIDSLREGASVAPVAATIDESGVVRDLGPQDEAGAEGAVAGSGTGKAPATGNTGVGATGN